MCLTFIFLRGVQFRHILYTMIMNGPQRTAVSCKKLWQNGNKWNFLSSHKCIFVLEHSTKSYTIGQLFTYIPVSLRWWTDFLQKPETGQLADLSLAQAIL